MCTTNVLYCDVVAGFERELSEVRVAEATLAARKVALVDGLRRANEAHDELLVVGIDDHDDRSSFVERSTRAQVACALRITEIASSRLIDEALWLMDHLPQTLAALTVGDISYRHATALIDDAESLPDAAVAIFELTVLAGRLDIPAARFAARCRRVREHVHPDTIDKRAKSAERSRGVSVQHARDGMAWLMAYLPVMQAELAHTLLSGIAKDEWDAGDPRTLDQLRADVLIDALLRSGRPASVADGADAAAAMRGGTPTVSITVPALTLLGLSDEPACMDGYGPIPLESAKMLAAQAPSWRRILTHPVTGVRLSYDRESYRVPAALRSWLIDRDGTCRFPGCGRKARKCDADHVEDWAGSGCTDHDNLAHVCRKHHRLKHHTTWWARFEDDLLVWTSPTGLEYTTGPREDREPLPLMNPERRAFQGDT